MKLLRGLNSLAVLEQGAALTIGNFDGVHQGHQALLKRLCERARARNLLSVVLFFEPQPAEFFKAQATTRLMSRQQKLRFLKKLGVDYAYCIKFNHIYAALSSETFAVDYLFRLFHAQYLLVGEDFRFGQHRTGTPQYLMEMGAKNACEVETFGDFVENNKRVSSTEIREALAKGDLTRAHAALGRPYSVYGRVVKGEGRGRGFGIPTANVWTRQQVLPLKGVFLVQVRLKQGLYWGVANVGYRPTFEGTYSRLEVHLFDFNASLYQEYIEVFFIAQLREERKFSSVETLVAQIYKDCDQAKAWIRDRLLGTIDND